HTEKQQKNSTRAAEKDTCLTVALCVKATHANVGAASGSPDERELPSLLWLRPQGTGPEPTG
ncbi:hypothetical protein INR49_018420, partial [Caranx melampygus]